VSGRDTDNWGRIGGIAGSNDATISGCSATGNISGIAFVGRITGENSGTLTNNSALSTMTVTINGTIVSPPTTSLIPPPNPNDINGADM